MPSLHSGHTAHKSAGETAQAADGRGRAPVLLASASSLMTPIWSMMSRPTTYEAPMPVRRSRSGARKTKAVAEKPKSKSKSTAKPARGKPLAPAARRTRRGFNLIELLMALAITSALLTAVMVSLHASFMAYQATTEVASTHTISRLCMNRMLTLIRTGQDFGPFPTDPLQDTIASDYIEFITPGGDYLTMEWRETEEALYVVLTDPDDLSEASYKLLEGVRAQYRPADDPDDPGGRIKPFTLQYEKGRHLYRATIDMAVKPDDNMSVSLDGNNEDLLRLVASAMPRLAAY